MSARGRGVFMNSCAPFQYPALPTSAACDSFSSTTLTLTPGPFAASSAAAGASKPASSGYSLFLSGLTVVRSASHLASESNSNPDVGNGHLTSYFFAGGSSVGLCAVRLLSLAGSMLNPAGTNPIKYDLTMGSRPSPAYDAAGATSTYRFPSA